MTPSGLTRPTLTTPTSPRAAGRPASATYPARSSAAAWQSTSTITLSRSPLIYDLKHDHGMLIRYGGLESEARIADVNDPVYLERMEIVIDLRS